MYKEFRWLNESERLWSSADNEWELKAFNMISVA